MKLSSAHLQRYKELARILWRYGRSDLVQQMSKSDGFELDAPSATPPDAETSPERLTDDLEAMGPTYIKLGQVLAGRPDLLPEPYLRALARLQDRVKPFPYEQVEQIVMTELGARISKAFSSFDPEPLAAASLGQVHAAALRDGRAVVVKIQRPDIRKQIAEDFEVLEQLAGFFDEHTDFGRRYRLRSVLDEFRITIQQELDYLREAQNLTTLRENLREFPLIEVPRPIADYCTRSVLTMERVHGQKITALSPLARMDINGHALAEELFRAYLKQVLVDGVFHADPHPGNIFITDDKRVAFLDLGMVGHTAPRMQESLLKILLAINEGSGDDVADLVIHISEKLDGFDPAEFRRRINQLVASRRDQGLEQMNVGKSLLDVSRSARENNLFVPSELTLLGKTLLQLDQVGRTLAPDFNPQASIRENVDDLMSRRMQKDFSRGGFFNSVLELKEFASHLPTRLNRIMDAVTNSELEVKVRSVDATTFLDGMQKIANRITTGLILAALVIGASLLMRVETNFQIFGYPGLAILCFLAAAGGGFGLVISIFVQDHRSRKKLPR